MRLGRLGCLHHAETNCGAPAAGQNKTSPSVVMAGEPPASRCSLLVKAPLGGFLRIFGEFHVGGDKTMNARDFDAGAIEAQTHWQTLSPLLIYLMADL